MFYKCKYIISNKAATKNCILKMLFFRGVVSHMANFTGQIITVGLLISWVDEDRDQPSSAEEKAASVVLQGSGTYNGSPFSKHYHMCMNVSVPQ